MTHDQVALHARPAQVDVAVLEPRLFGDLDLVGDHERRRLRFVQQTDLGRADLDLPRRDLRVDGFLGAVLDAAADGHDELRSQPLRVREQRVVVARHNLGDTIPVAEVDEDERSQVAHAVHPAEQHDVLADVLRPQGPAGVRAGQCSEWFNLHESASSLRS